LSGRLSGLGCLIVGGTSGIGLASARRFLQEGASVVLTGPDNALASQRTLMDLGKVHSYPLDLGPGTQPAVAELFEFALDVLDGRLDILLHVAGISGRRFGDGPLDECSDEGWDAVMSVNARGVFLTNREAARRMRAQPIDAHGLRGTVVNVGSVLADSPSPAHFSTIAYAASKGAIKSLTLAAAAHYAPERIRFNLLSPGLIETPMSARAVGNATIRAYLTHKQPLAGGPGTVDDVGEAALYLCEPASRFVTGSELRVDGGWSLCEGSPTP
jgi:NAD(P)-dependent dehydrogenase (short-subunit alcohol dehydrogenase family)